MIETCLVVGFGRMGISHSTILSGLLGCKKVEFYVVDKSFVNRGIAKQLLENCRTFRSIDHALRQAKSFSYGLICTPPQNREDLVAVCSKHCAKLFVEKPVIAELPNHGMSGYVLQHLPILDRLDCDNGNGPLVIHASMRTNIRFSEVVGWRASNSGGIVNEFLGHTLTFALAIATKVGKSVDFIELESVSRTPTAVRVLLRYNEFDVAILLEGSCSVRKTEYECELIGKTSKIKITPYSIEHIKGDGQNYNIAMDATSVSYYVRGFEFSRQMEKLISGEGDLLHGSTIKIVEEIIKKVKHHD